MPSADELHTGQTRIERLRDIEPDDLLCREPVVLDEAGVAQTLRNNTLGTYHAALATAAVGAGRFVLICTDKAVNPTHVADGRIRRWAAIAECEGRWLGVVLLADGEAVHNALFDRRFTP